MVPGQTKPKAIDLLFHGPSYRQTKNVLPPQLKEANHRRLEQPEWSNLEEFRLQQQVPFQISARK